MVYWKAKNYSLTPGCDDWISYFTNLSQIHFVASPRNLFNTYDQPPCIQLKTKYYVLNLFPNFKIQTLTLDIHIWIQDKNGDSKVIKIFIVSLLYYNQQHFIFPLTWDHVNNRHEAFDDQCSVAEDSIVRGGEQTTEYIHIAWHESQNTGNNRNIFNIPNLTQFKSI